MLRYAWRGRQKECHLIKRDKNDNDIRDACRFDTAVDRGRLTELVFPFSRSYADLRVRDATLLYLFAE